ncbi:homoserine O-acetyltransferase [Wenzhouxiangella marina]|nr:homoserine O-acetyltransferase [Wenzhouxiangella marina]
MRVVLGGISASRQVQCWWRQHHGRGQALDPARDLILGMDWLDHPTGVSTADQADGLLRIVDHLELGIIDTLIGASYGAMVGLALAQRHGHRLRHLIAISGADRSCPSAMAIRRIQREILALGEELRQPERGVAWARALAMTSYRPPALFDQRFAHTDPSQVAREIDAYLGHQGRRYSHDQSLARYRCLSRSLDEHCIEPAMIRCRVDLVGVDSDALVPLAQLEALAEALGPRARLHRLSSSYGHDAFLKENNALKHLLSSLIETGGGA